MPELSVSRTNALAGAAVLLVVLVLGGRLLLGAGAATSVPDGEVALGAEEGVRDGSVANLDNLQLLPVDRLLRRAGRISRARWPEFCAAMRKVMAC